MASSDVLAAEVVSRPNTRAQLTALRDRYARSLLWLLIASFTLWAAAVHPREFTVGIVVGSVIALGALGLTLIYGILQFAHFAHGDAMMTGAYFAYFLLTGSIVASRSSEMVLPLRLDQLPGATEPLGPFSFGYGLLIAIVLGGILVAGLLLAIDRLVYRRLRARGAGLAIYAVASLGVAIAMRSAVLMLWGPTPVRYISGIRPTLDLPGGVILVTDQVFIIGMAALLTLGVYYLLFHTELGRAMRAMADNRDLALISGIDIAWVIRWTWIVSGLLIGIAGSLLSLQSQLKPELGFLLLLPIFAAAILGGIGSPRGALVGGLVVGVAQEVAVTLPHLSPGYKFSVAFVILILVILLVPRGLFGESS